MELSFNDIVRIAEFCNDELTFDSFECLTDLEVTEITIEEPTSTAED